MTRPVVLLPFRITKEPPLATLGAVNRQENSVMVSSPLITNDCITVETAEEYKELVDTKLGGLIGLECFTHSLLFKDDTDFDDTINYILKFIKN